MQMPLFTSIEIACDDSVEGILLDNNERSFPQSTLLYDFDGSPMIVYPTKNHSSYNARKSEPHHHQRHMNNLRENRTIADVSSHCKSRSIPSSSLSSSPGKSKASSRSKGKSVQFEDLPLLKSQLGVSKPSERVGYVSAKMRHTQEVFALSKKKQIEREEIQRQERRKRLMQFQKFIGPTHAVRSRRQEQPTTLASSLSPSPTVAMAWVLMGNNKLKPQDEMSRSTASLQDSFSNSSKASYCSPGFMSQRCNGTSTLCSITASKDDDDDDGDEQGEDSSALLTDNDLFYSNDSNRASRACDTDATHMITSSGTRPTKDGLMFLRRTDNTVEPVDSDCSSTEARFRTLSLQRLLGPSDRVCRGTRSTFANPNPLVVGEIYDRNDGNDRPVCSQTHFPDSKGDCIQTGLEDPSNSHNRSDVTRSSTRSSSRRSSRRPSSPPQDRPLQRHHQEKQKRRGLPKYLKRFFVGDKMSDKGSASLWKSAVDPRTGRTYYYHEQTRETQWRKPMELASSDERRAMEEKERKQKSFFAAMEANILNSMSQGIVPGTPKNAPTRQKSKQPPVTNSVTRPELIRTISAMDETVLQDLIRRQPSFRDVRKSRATEDSGLGRGFASITRPNEPLDSLEESISEYNIQAADEVFNGRPIENTEGDGSLSGDEFDFHSSSRSDGGKMNESSSAGFGLTWEETQALKKLAEITKEMADSENIDLEADHLAAMKLGGTSGETPSIKPSKGKARELPRELDFSDSDDEDDKDPVATQKTPAGDLGGFQKGTANRALPRELDFSDSDSDDDAPTPVKTKSIRFEDKNDKKSKNADDDMVRPSVRRRNTCGTLYVGTTMSAPDKDATIRCVSGVYRAHIKSSEAIGYDACNDNYAVFNDLESDQGQLPFQYDDEQIEYEVPTLDQVSSFYRDIFFKAQMEADCIIMSLIYVERLIKRTNGLLRPRASNWRSLLFSCMILSSKVWDDLSMWNVDFSQSCPPGVSFPLQRINQLELSVLNALTFQVKVLASEYAKYYFLLRSMLIKSGLGGDEISTLDPLDVEGARKLQHMSGQFEAAVQSKTTTLNMNNRSKSMGVAEQAKSNARKYGTTKLGLEHVVKM